MARMMKDSRVSWIGMIPDSWQMARVKYFYDCLDGKRIPVDSADRKSGPYPYWGAGKVMDYVDNYIFDEELILLGEDGAPFFDPTRPVAFLINERVWVNNHIHVLKPKSNIDSGFLTHWFNNVDYKTYINGSILNKLTQSNMDSIAIAVPPLFEQTRIAKYLDKEYAYIDEVIEKTRTSIEEYKKLKQSIITQAVTKGIRSNRKMKDSGIEWIGEIPEHWNICKQKHVIQLINGRAYSDNEFEVDGKYKILRVGNLFSNPVWYTSSLELDPDKYCDEGDLLYAWSMSYAPVIWHGEKVIYHYHIWKTKLSPKMDKEFAYYYFIVLTEAVRAEKHETTMGFITMGVMNNSYIAFPPIDEQIEITNYLNARCSSIENLIEKKKQLLSELESYKKSLIYEYVTGKKRCRYECERYE